MHFVKLIIKSLNVQQQTLHLILTFVLHWSSQLLKISLTSYLSTICYLPAPFQKELLQHHDLRFSDYGWERNRSPEPSSLQSPAAGQTMEESLTAKTRYHSHSSLWHLITHQVAWNLFLLPFFFNSPLPGEAL